MDDKDTIVEDDVIVEDIVIDPVDVEVDDDVCTCGCGCASEAPVRERRASGAVSSLTLGILALFCSLNSFLAIAGFVLGIIGLVHGIHAKKADATDELAKAGFILSLVGLILSCLSVLLGFAALGFFSYYMRDIFRTVMVRMMFM